MRKKLALILTFATAILSHADEGMWMQDVMNNRQKNLCGSIVSYDFMGTGSLVSDHGLVITNHHVVYSDVAELSDAQHNYLENGFWAYELKDEIPIPGRSVQILVETKDVTDEVMELIVSGKVNEGPMMGRRLSGILEKKYEKQSGKMAFLYSMWKGSKYYVALYDVYKDVRLVAAPPAIIGAFGGDEDNWEWPQQKGDFSFVRIYTAPDGSPAEYSENNIPLNSATHLKISTRGVREGDKTMVIGFPGRTNRYAGSALVNFQTEVSLPVIVEVRGAQMEILRKWMNADQSVRAKYSDHFFGLSNAQELYMGQVQCCKRFGVTSEKRELEKELAAWIAKDAGRCAKWGTLLDDLNTAYSASAPVEKQIAYFRECMSRASKLGPVASRLSSLKKGGKTERFTNFKKSAIKDYASMDLRVERDIFRDVLERYMTNMSDELLGPWQRELKGKFGKDYDALCAYLWDESWMTTPEGIRRLMESEAGDIENGLNYLCADRLCRWFNDLKMGTLNEARDKALNGVSTWQLNTNYTRALYSMRLDKGIRQYPDANSSLRITYGKVCGLSPRDAVSLSWKSTVAGLLEKHRDHDHDFCLPEDWRATLATAPKDMTVNFISDNDITGGNSGSPVMNSRGEVVGLAFDGNKESLASDVSFTPDYNRCICVDIRFVLWTLRNYAHFDRLLDEMGVK